MMGKTYNWCSAWGRSVPSSAGYKLDLSATTTRGWKP